MKSRIAVVATVVALAVSLHAQVPASQHVIVVVEENHNYSQVIGSSAMPYLNSLANQYGLATQYYANTHPSIGNYFMMTTGQIITNNDSYNGVVSADNLVRHLLSAGKTWKSYAEGLPSVGYVGGDTGNYVRHHNPFTYLSDVFNSSVQKQNLVPFTRFAPDLNNNALPDIAFIIPNLINDAHDGTLQQADAWLQTNIAPILNNSAFQQDGILIIVFDEAASDNTHGGGRIAFVVAGPNVIPGGGSSNLYQHQSLLRTIMEAVGLTSFPGAAATASDMHDLFNQVVLSPTSLTFGSQTVGTTSSPQSVTLTNKQSSAVTGISISASGDFGQTNNCGTSVAANSSCTIDVTFSPTSSGTRTGTLTVTDSAGTQTVSLTGTGTGVGNVTLTPSSVNFGNQGVGTTSSAHPVTLSNGGTSALTGISIAITGVNAGDFGQTNNCGTTLGGSASCTINVKFTPSGYGTRTATLTVTDSAGTQTSSLSGSGTDITPPTTQITAPADGATVSGTVTVTATASDNVGVALIQIFIDGTQVASGATSPLNYSWNTAGVNNGSHTIYSVASDAAGNTGNSTIVTVTVNNNNVLQQLLQNTGFETGNLTYWNAGGVYLPVATSAKHNMGSYSAQLGSSVTPEPNGDSWLYQTVTIPSSTTAGSLNFSYWGACSDTVANDWQEVQIQNASGGLLKQVMKVCNNSQTWTRVYFNLYPYRGQTLRIYFNNHGNGNNHLSYMYVDDVTVSIKGGSSGSVTLAPGSLNFGNQGVGTTSSAQVLTLTNGDVNALTGISVGLTGTNAGDFNETDNCGTTLAANSSCMINVTFTPTAAGARSATLTVSDSAGTQSSSLTGTGTDATPPTTQITAPANGATVSGNVTITATASDNVGVTSIEIYVDGALKATGTTSPFSYTWNSATVTNGTHTIYSKALDAAGNVGTSATVTVTVNNGGVQQLFDNSDFETGNLAGWNAGGAYVPFVTSAQHHVGSYSAQLGASTGSQPNGDSWIYQTATVPSTSVGASLNFYYKGYCADTVANDWQEVQIQNTSGVVLAQVMKVCSNAQTWTRVYFNLLPYKGQTIRVVFNVHGDGGNKLTYMYIDDATFSVK